MTEGAGAGRERAWLRYLAAGLGMALLLVMAPLYLSAGLIAPLWAVLLLIGFWVLLMVLGVLWFRRRPFLVLALPLLAAAVWWLSMAAGEQLLGWTA